MTFNYLSKCTWGTSNMSFKIPGIDCEQLAEQMNELLLAYDRNKQIIYVNSRSFDLLGYQPDELVGASILRLIAKGQKALVYREAELRLKGETAYYEVVFRHKDGTNRTVRVKGSPIREGDKITGGWIIAEDITALSLVKQALDQSGERWQHLVENMPGAYLIHCEGDIVYANKEALAILRAAKPGEVIGKNIMSFVHNDYHELASGRIKQLSAQKSVPLIELKMLRLDETVMDVEIIGTSIFFEGRRAIQAIFHDTTDKKQALLALKENEEKYRQLFNRANDAIFVYEYMNHGRSGCFMEVNDVAYKRLGYTKEELLKMNIDDIRHHLNPQVIKEANRLLAQQGHATFKTYHKSKRGEKIPVEINAHLVQLDGKKAVLSIARDITERVYVEKELRRNYDTLMKNMESTIYAMTDVVETRDPYTAGHQQRVANLAFNIGKELNLTEEKLTSVRLAAAVHDIGKIYVPAEILSKPKKLTEIEFGLIKAHPEVGHDILKKIDLPWPVAKIVLQHHERLNGSGYPAGLTGNKIFIEAKIIAVADVVEAMASHRPYRPMLGIDKALEEISRNKGVLYDPKVVEVCLLLFKRGFNLEQSPEII